MARNATTRRKTKYQILTARKKSYCKGKITKASLNKAVSAYIAEAVKKGSKTKAEAEKIAKAVVNGACTVSVAGRKTSRKTSRRKKAA